VPREFRGRWLRLGLDQLGLGEVERRRHLHAAADAPRAEHHRILAQGVPQGIALLEQDQGLQEVARQVDTQGRGVSLHRRGGGQALGHAQPSRRKNRGDGQVGIGVGRGDAVLQSPIGRVGRRRPQAAGAIVVAPLGIDRRARAPGDTPDAAYQFNFSPDSQVYYAYDYISSIALPLPSSGGVVGITKISENNSPMPRDRVLFVYDYFSNVPLVDWKRSRAKMSHWLSLRKAKLESEKPDVCPNTDQNKP
jgi:hypothetical protein